MKQRNTIQKKLIYDAVSKIPNHPTAEEVYNQIVKDHPAVSKGTVYRNLNFLAQNNTLTKIPMPSDADRFDINTHPHSHIICTRCGKFMDIAVDGMDEFGRKIEEESGFQLSSHYLVFTGLCKDCRKESSGDEKE